MTKHIEHGLASLKEKIDQVQSDFDKTEGMITVNQNRLQQDFELKSVEAAKTTINKLAKQEGDLTTEAETQFKELQKEVDF